MIETKNNNVGKSAFIRWTASLLLICFITLFSVDVFAQTAQQAITQCNKDFATLIPDGLKKDACTGSYIFSKIICRLQNRITLISCYMYNYFAGKLSPIISTIIIIYVSIFGVLVVLGLNNITAAEAVTRLLKIAIIWVLATNVTYGFTLMHSFFNGAMQLGVSLATTNPNIGDSSKDVQCLSGPGAAHEMGAFINLECIFRSMFGFDSTNKEMRELTKARKEEEQIFAQCMEDQGCQPDVCAYVLSTKSLEEQWLTYCEVIESYARGRKCSVFNKQTGLKCMPSDTPAKATKKCKYFWSECTASQSAGCQKSVLNYKENYIYLQTLSEALAADAANPARVGSFFIGALAFMVIPVVGPTLSMFFISIGFLMLYMFVRAVLGYLLVVVTIALLVSTSAIFLVFAFFESTEEYFEKWYTQLGEQIIQPFILFAALMMFNHYILGYVTYFQRLIDTGFVTSTKAKTTDIGKAILSFNIPRLDFEHIAKIGATHPYSDNELIYSKKYMEDHGKVDYTPCLKLKKLADIDNKGKLDCYKTSRVKDAGHNLVINMSVAASKANELPLGKTGSNIDDNAYMSCLKNIFTDCKGYKLRKVQYRDFANDVWEAIIATIVLTFAMIAFIENIGTMVRITALKYTSMGPNIAPVPKKDLRSGSSGRMKQYASFGMVESGALGLRKKMRTGFIKGTKMQWKVFYKGVTATDKSIKAGKAAGGAAWKATKYSYKTSVTDAAKDAGRGIAGSKAGQTTKRAAMATAAAGVATVAAAKSAIQDPKHAYNKVKQTASDTVDAAKQKAHDAVDVADNKLKQVNANINKKTDMAKEGFKSVVKSVDEDGIKATGQKIKQKMDNYVSDNLDTEALRKDKESMLYKAVDGISEASIQVAADVTDSKSGFGKNIEDLKGGNKPSVKGGNKPSGLTQEDIEATSPHDD